MNAYQYRDGLESERLVSRKLTLDDVPAWSEFFTTDETTEFLKAHVLATPEESAARWIERQMQRYEKNEYGLQGLFEKRSGAFIGLSGLILQDVDGRLQEEVGYHVLKKHWGKGYAPEAARMFFDYGFNELRLETLISIIHIDNVKSQRVADKNGLRREKQVWWKEMDLYIYRINREVWK